MIVPEIMYSVVTNTCAKCHQGKVFENNNPYNLKNGLSMKEECSCCGFKYEREPGFFYGSMYVNYALTSGIFIILFALDSFFWHMETWVLLTIIIAFILILFPVTFRVGRILWINFFARYDERLKNVCKKN